MIRYSFITILLLLASFVLQQFLPAFTGAHDSRVLLVQLVFLCCAVTVGQPTMLLLAFMRGVGHVLPQGDKKRLSEQAVADVCALTTLFLGAVHALLLWYALTPGANITTPVIALMGLMWVALGLMLPRFRRNPIVGVRTPWTLTSDENWAKTQRFAGYSMVVGGLLGLVAGVVGGGPGVWIAIGAFMASALVPAGYSLVLARRAGS